MAMLRLSSAEYDRQIPTSMMLGNGRTQEWCESRFVEEYKNASEGMHVRHGYDVIGSRVESGGESPSLGGLGVDAPL